MNRSSLKGILIDAVTSKQSSIIKRKITKSKSFAISGFGGDKSLDTDLPSVSRQSKRFSSIRKILTLSEKMENEKNTTKRNFVSNSQSYKRFKNLQKFIHILLEDPGSSLIGRIFQTIIILGIIVNFVEAIIFSTKNNLIIPKAVKTADDFFLIIFTMEFSLRILTSSAFGRKTLASLYRPIIIVDLITAIPLFLSVSSYTTDTPIDFPCKTLIVLFKSLTLFKLLRYINATKIVIEGFKKSISSLAFLLFVIIILSFISSITVYYAEKSQPTSPFQKGISGSFYWALVTITTVGYGDMVPLSITGKLIASIMSIFGMILITLPVVILGYHFQEAYNESEDEKTMERIKLQELSKRVDISENQKEIFFLKRRICSIEESNINIKSQLENSTRVYQNVSNDLKNLYRSIYTAGFDQMDSFGHSLAHRTKTRRASIYEKFSNARIKLKLKHIFNNQFNSLDATSQSESENMYRTEALDTINAKTESALKFPQFIENHHKIEIHENSESQENINFETIEFASPSPNTLIKKAPFFSFSPDDRKSSLFKSKRGDSNNYSVPKIIICPNDVMSGPDQKESAIYPTPPKLSESIEYTFTEGSPCQSTSYINTLAGQTDFDSKYASKGVIESSKPKSSSIFSLSVPSIKHKGSLRRVIDRKSNSKGMEGLTIRQKSFSEDFDNEPAIGKQITFRGPFTNKDQTIIDINSAL